MIGLIFGRKHVPKTIFIIIVALVCARLGIWQLDRLEWRRGENEKLRTQIALPPESLNAVADDDQVLTMLDQTVTVSGSFDFDEQVILKGRSTQFGTGVHLVAPFVLEGTNTAIMVDRGWLSSAEANNDPHIETLTTVTGSLQPSFPLPRNATGNEDAGDEIFEIVIPLLDNQSTYQLLPVYLLQAPLPTDDANTRPYRAPISADLSEGNHFSYAVQWFSFATIAIVGYIFYLRRYG